MADGTPLIIDTDIGGDPDDAIALAAAARTVPELVLVLTNDETGPDVGHGQRARFARRLLDALGRDDVEVAAGHSAGATRYFCVEDLVPERTAPSALHDRSAPSSDVLTAVGKVLAATGGPVRWVGIGAFSNLARVLRELPEAAPRLRVTQMGGALRYRDPSRAEHNVRMDVPAAHDFLRHVAAGRLPRPTLVTSDVTFTTHIEVTPESAPRLLPVRADGPEWAALLRRHLDRWFARFYPGSMQHDALALSAALGLPFVRTERASVALDGIGRMSAAEGGAEVRLSVSADYPAFNDWLERVLQAP
ncbi:nucleoside hydrolase [Marinitenerispora sediminis]|uniref:Nucleoside hydrolase n=1 Tax=Marinitenerispora sediminis TaxID=1931232 RepID=A0A368T6V6_9ACTN|nr:nucleoside hydrolase [Marinitenerispora sediminis]RCV49065.1 nucleoside hydrolase [Marinitenerispora sediminis]RCV51778.1 nucleoside hydrolase [Marinitenerispora sediminis]RCV59244.1 nucleoside hydrolase [Marinitenerispora sediminis]